MYNDELSRKKMKKVERMKKKSARHEKKRMNALRLGSEALCVVREASLGSDGSSSHGQHVSSPEPSPHSSSPFFRIITEVLPTGEAAVPSPLLRDSFSPIIECTVADLDKCDADNMVKMKEEFFPAAESPEVPLEKGRYSVSISGADSSIVLDTESDIVLADESLSISTFLLENEVTTDTVLSSVPPHGTIELETESTLPVTLNCTSLTTSVSHPQRAGNPLSQPVIELSTPDAISPSGTVSSMQVSDSVHNPTAMLARYRTIHGAMVPPIIGIPWISDISPIQSKSHLRRQKLVLPAAAAASAAASMPQRNNIPRVPKSQHVPRDFDVFVRLGQARRTLIESKERQSRERDADDLRFRPQLSRYAAQREPRTNVEFVAASREWERRRLDRVRAAAARAEAAAREERRRRAGPLNSVSERMVREMDATRRRAGVLAQSQQHAAARQSRLNALRAKLEPAFRPDITQLAQRIRKGGAGEEEANFARLYERLMEYRTLVERRRKQRVDELDKAEHVPVTRRSRASVLAHVNDMAKRDAARRDRAQRVAQRKAAEEEAARMAFRTRVNARSAELAARHRQREKERKEQAAVQNKKPTENKKNAQSQRNPPTYRKLAYPPSKGDNIRRPTVPLVAPDFEERNAQLLKRRELYCEIRRREEDEMITRACTFHPVINKTTDFTQGGRTSWPLDTPPRDAESVTASLEREGNVNHAMRLPSIQRDCSRDMNLKDDEELSQQIQCLEEMLLQWKQLEKEFSA